MTNGDIMFKKFKIKDHWHDYKDSHPDPNIEIITFYLNQSDEGTACYISEIMNSKFITKIQSPFIYWCEFPEIHY